MSVFCSNGKKPKLMFLLKIMLSICLYTNTIIEPMRYNKYMYTYKYTHILYLSFAAFLTFLEFFSTRLFDAFFLQFFFINSFFFWNSVYFFEILRFPFWLLFLKTCQFIISFGFLLGLGNGICYAYVYGVVVVTGRAEKLKKRF